MNLHGELKPRQAAWAFTLVTIGVFLLLLILVGCAAGPSASIPPRKPTPTRTPYWHPLPSPTATPHWGPALTATPNASGPPLVKMQAIQWQWDFYIDGAPSHPHGEVTLYADHDYRVQVVNADPLDVEEAHGVQSITAIGLKGGLIAAGETWPVQLLTPRVVGDFQFSCTNYCGNGHDGMIGVVHVVRATGARQ